MAQPIQNLDLDSGEFGPVDDVAPPGVPESIINQLVGQALQPEGVAQEEVNDSYLDEVDTRLEVATYYRELLKAPLFQDSCKASLIVEKEIRDFTHTRLKVLFGISPRPDPITITKSPFNELETSTLLDLASLKPIEITTLRMILAQVLKATGGAAKAEPALKAAAAPEVKPTPSITPRQVPQATGRTQSTSPGPGPAPAKRGPGRPPKEKETITVLDPVTNQTKELIVKTQVKNDRGIPMPTGSALFAATMMAAQKSSSNMEKTPEAKAVMGAIGG